MRNAIMIGVLPAFGAGAPACILRTACVPGATTSCTCPGELDGVQSCRDDGTFEACACAPGGGGSPDLGRAAVDASAPPDLQRDLTPAPFCGDGVCNGTETCIGCAKDCGACDYKPCTLSSDCPPGVSCVDFTADGIGKRCAKSCGTDSQCPASPPGYSALAGYCAVPFNRYFCFLRCSGPGAACPFGLSCQATGISGTSLCK